MIGGPKMTDTKTNRAAGFVMRLFGLRHPQHTARLNIHGDFQAALRFLRLFSAPENPRASSVHNLVHKDAST